LSKSIDVRTPGYDAIAKKWNLPVAKVTSLVDDGSKVEKEHVKSNEKAKQIARDHIAERPDYYKKLRKMEKTPVKLKEEGTGVSGIRGLGYVSGDPAGSDPVQDYIDTNTMSYTDFNGNRLKWIKKITDGHNAVGFKEFNPTKLKEGMSTEPERDSETIGDYTGSSRKVMKVDEVKISPKIKKAAKVGMTLANLATLGQVAGDAAEGRKGVDPKRGLVAATSALPGAVGWGATGLNYTIKGYDKAREHLRSKVKKMQEDWQDVNRKDKTDGLSQKAVNAYRRENPGSKLQTAVTEKNPTGKRAARRKAFCSRMGGMKKRLTSAKTARDPDSNINKALRRWNCEESTINEISAELVGKVSNARFWRKEAPSKTLTRAINKKFIESGKKKDNTKTVKKEESTMDTKNIVNEALDNILDNNLVEMKQNLLTVLQEKVNEKLEEKKKEIASNYFAQ
jgi:hypothetical protein